MRSRHDVVAEWREAAAALAAAPAQSGEARGCRADVDKLRIEYLAVLKADLNPTLEDPVAARAALDASDEVLAQATALEALVEERLAAPRAHGVDLDAEIARVSQELLEMAIVEQKSAERMPFETVTLNDVARAASRP